MRLLVVVLLVLTGVAAVAANATTDVMTKPGWRIYDLHIREGETVVTETVLTSNDSAYLLFKAFRTDGSTRWNGQDESEQLTMRAVASVDGVAAVDAQVPALLKPLSIGGTRDFEGPAHYVILVAAMGDIMTVTIKNTGVLRAAGDQAWFVDGAAMGGGAYAEAAVTDSSVFAAKERSISFDIEHTLIGHFGGDAYYSRMVGERTLTGPFGSRECPCVIADATPEGRLGGGRYTFEMDGVGTHVNRDPVAAWVDVPLP